VDDNFNIHPKIVIFAFRYFCAVIFSMKKKRLNFKYLFQRLSFKYRVSVMNENTLEESWHIRLSRISVFLFGSALVLFTFVLLTVLIFTTPIKHYLPGYGDSGNRAKIIQESLQVDSLMRAIQQQNKYLTVMRAIIDGRVKPDSIASLDSVALKKQAEILDKKSETEDEYVKKYEEDEKYNLGSITVKPKENGLVFFRPTSGVISSGFNPSADHYGISIITSPNESVQSVLDGTVVFAAFTFDSGWVIQVQHENNYLSVYKNNIRLLKKTGDDVKAGESIAVAGEGGAKKNYSQFYFELWKMGKPVNPEEVIIF